MFSEKKSLKALIERDELLVMPGGFSPYYARMAEETGFEAFFLAGSQMSWMLYGVPDVGLLGMRDVAAHARAIAQASNIALLIDGDTGYGNAIGVHYAVREFAATGASGVQFEDQEAPKKSGTGGGRRCISVEEAVGKYKAAIAARNEFDPDFAIVARCDAIGAEGESFESAIERCAAYLTDGGADIVWLNSVTTLDEVERACAAIPGPVLCTWGGRPGGTPTAEQFADAGLRVLMFPTITASIGAQATWQVLHNLAAEGTKALDDWSGQVAAGSAPGLRSVDLVGLSGISELERQFLPNTLQRDYGSTFGSFSGSDRPD